MAKDFSAKQIRTNTLIASGGVGGTRAGLAIYSASIASNFVGGTTKDATLWDDVGDDVFLFVSGSKGSKVSRLDPNNGDVGVSLFGGDVVVSGTMYAERMVVEVDGSVTGSLLVSGSLIVSQSALLENGLTVLLSKPGPTSNALYISGSGTTGNTYARITDSSLDFTKKLSALWGIYDTQNSSYHGDTAFVGGGTDTDLALRANNADKVVITSGSYARNTGRMLIFSGGNATDADHNQIKYSDVNFFVSGSIGSRGSTVAVAGGDPQNLGTALFGGDVHVSGALSTEGGISISSSDTLQFTASMVDIGWDPSDILENTGPILRLTNHDTAIISSNILGSMEFAGADTSHGVAVGAKIVGHSGGVWGSHEDDNPAELQFYTTNEGNLGSLRLGMVINRDGDVGIGTSAPSGALDVQHNSLGNAKIFFLSGSGGQSSPDETTYADINFFVSGAIGRRGGPADHTGKGGTGLFGGDVHVSGALSLGPTGGFSSALYDENPVSVTSPSATGDNSVAIGDNCQVISTYSIVGGGKSNKINTNPDYAVIGGGVNNHLFGAGNYAVIAGGHQNTGSAAIHGFIGGGQGNYIQAGFATIVGGGFNTASAIYAIVAGGENNVASGQYSAILGSSGSTVSGKGSVAIGTEITASEANTIHIGGGGAASGYKTVISASLFKVGGGFLSDTGLQIFGMDTNVFMSGSVGSTDSSAIQGTAVFGGDTVISGVLKVGGVDFHEKTGPASGGTISGSIHHTSGGLSYLVAGTDITIMSASNGQVTINSTGHSTAGGWTDGGTDVYLTATTDQVGIGTASPATKLEVEVAVGEALGGLLIDFDETGVYKALEIDSEGSDAALGITGQFGAFINQDVSSGYAAWFTRDIAEAGSFPLVSIIDDNTNNTQTALKVKQDGTGDIVNFFDGATEVFTVADGGNVGIGTGEPSGSLDVFGDGATTQIFFLSGSGSPSDPMEKNYTDLAFFVSGAAGSIGTSTKGTSVFGGDMFVSGTLVVSGAQRKGKTYSGGSISGSIHQTALGLSYLVAGSSISIASSSNGQLTISTSAGTGNVSSAGTPSDNQIAIWTNSSTIEGVGSLQFDGLTLTVTGDSALAGAVTVNDAAADKDFRVESSDIPGIILTDAGTNQLLLHTSGTTAATAGAVAGTDVAIYLSGAVGSRGVTNSKGTAVFTGDVVISGSVYGGSPFSVGTTSEITGALYLKDQGSAPSVHASGQGVIYSRAGSIYIKNAAGAEQSVGSNASGWKDASGVVSLFTPGNRVGLGTSTPVAKLVVGSGAGNSGHIHLDGGETLSSSISFSKNIGATAAALVLDKDEDLILVNSGSNKDIIFKITDSDSPWGTERSAIKIDASEHAVLILSGGGGGSIDEGDYSDLTFFVSGAVGSLGGPTRGTAIFGGDMVISGVLKVGGEDFHSKLHPSVGGTISGSIHHTSGGLSYLVAGSNTTITSASNGQVTISSTAGGSQTPNVGWIPAGDGIISTTGSVYFGVSSGVTSPDITFAADGTAVFNEQGAPGADFRVESSDIPGIILSDAGTNQLLLHTSGTTAATVGSVAGTDVAIYLSGAVGSKGVANSKGAAVFTGDLFISGTLVVSGAYKPGKTYSGGSISGSIHHTALGLSYLQAGASVTIASSSNGQVTISSTATGNVSSAGTPSDNQITVWTDSTTIEGTSGLTYDGSSLGLNGHIIPGSDSTYDLGSEDNRWRNVYTGDLHLRNEKGNWTIQEDTDRLIVINNITGKRYKMMLAPLEDEE